MTAAVGVPAQPPTVADERQVLIVTTEVPPDRVASFRALAELVPFELALFGGGLHATAGVQDHGLLAREIRQREAYALAASGRYRAVIAGTGGRTALPAAWLGAERAGVPFLLWSALWAHPRSLAHLPGDLLLRLLYRRATVVLAYGPHVADFAATHGAKRIVVAPQAVDASRWSSPQPHVPAEPARFLFIGRDDPGKGVDLLLQAWAASRVWEQGAELELLGPAPARSDAGRHVVARGSVAPEAVREALRGALALVVPSERTATFREPWGLVVNEAMHGGVAVIATDEVGAAAGGLVLDDDTGLVVHAGDVGALAGALQRLVRDRGEAARLGAAGYRAVGAYTPEAWAAAVAAALADPVRSRP